MDEAIYGKAYSPATTLQTSGSLKYGETHAFNTSPLFDELFGVTDKVYGVYID